MVTLKMIAEACGVSTATVSKALNNVSDISPDTARRIQGAAREMGYLPNAAARALKTKHSHNLGALVSMRDRRGRPTEFISTVLNAFQAAAEAEGYDITLLSNRIGGSSGSYLEHCRYRGFDGVALICFNDTESPELREMRQDEFPCVAVDSAGSEYGSVMTDNELAMRELVDYVCAMGHRRVAMISGEEAYVSRMRKAAFYRACRDRGIRVPEEYMLTALYNDPEASAEAVRRLMALDVPPTCIFFPDDLAYLGGQGQLEALGLSVPGDVSCVGFDGVFLSQAIRPRLTTYRQNSVRMGEEAFKMLREAIEHPRGYMPRQLLLPGELLPGETVARIP